ncbi:teichuronic acid biosynthesis protein TuaE [Bacillus sp. PS06]|uniref:teichuronic acid biosynthesis protein TuaE n=1 Tax=Bacillus sp. PS06 TaxID=2764176 RepID=UPI00177FFA82|nr:O-antigen ligase family protein [Bacillus sp. PS06]MBD8070885.1 O-antigen ligase family protein [Bacillus sp. PS06]
MEINLNAKLASGVAVITLSALFLVFYLIDMSQPFLLFAGLWTLIMIATLLIHSVDMNKLFTSVMYILVISTFFNQSFIKLQLSFFSLFLYRMLLIAALFLFIVYVLRERNLSDYWNQVKVKGVLLFLLGWLVYGAISLLWVKSMIDGIKYLLLLAIGILFVYLAVFTFTRVSKLLVFYGIWLVMTIFLLIIGLINHFGQIQLPTSTLYGGPEYKQAYPTAVFFNQNDFATFLTISFFFYCSAVKNSSNQLLRLSSVVLALLCVYIIYLTESRASLLALIIGLFVYMVILLPRYLKKIVLVVAGAAGVGGLAFLLQMVSFEPPLTMTENPSSNHVRLNLLKNTFHYFLNTYGFGVGAGNLPFYLEYKPIFNTAGVLEVHNWLAEIAGNFGIVIIVGYIIMYVYLFFSLLLNEEAQRNSHQKMLAEAAMVSLVAFLVSSISPSSVSNLYFHWVFLGFVIAMVSVFKSKAIRAEIDD